MPPELGPWLDALRGTRAGWAGPASALWALASGLALMERSLAEVHPRLLPHELGARREPLQGALRQVEDMWPLAQALMEWEGPPPRGRLRLAKRTVDLAVEALGGVKAVLDGVPVGQIGEVDQAWRLLLAAGEGGLALWEAHAQGQEEALALAERAAMASSARLLRDYAALAEAECAWRLRRSSS